MTGGLPGENAAREMRIIGQPRRLRALRGGHRPLARPAGEHDLPALRIGNARRVERGQRHHYRAGFEWHDHIAHARAAGLPADVIDCIGSAPTAALPQPYALVHAILEKTMAWQIVPNDLQVQAVTQWGKRGLVEIVVLSGFYQMFAAINQGFDIRPTPKPA